MELPFLDRESIDEFVLNFEMHKAHYQDSNNLWFVEYWKKHGAMHASGIEIDDIHFDFGSDYTQTDKHNVIAIHSALKNIPRSVAADERMWAALAHTVGWEFLKYRRVADIAKGDAQRLKSIFFFSAGTRRSCYLHGLAKYWWTGHLVFNPDDRKDPYAALDTLCSLPYFTSLVLFVFSSNCTANRNVLFGLIDSFATLQKEGIPFKEDHWKELLSYLNKLGSTIILDSLSRKDVCDICLRQLSKMLHLK